MGLRGMADWVGGGLDALLRRPVAAAPTIMLIGDDSSIRRSPNWLSF